MDEWLTVKDVARELGLTLMQVYNATRARTEGRRLHSIRVAGLGVRIHRSEVARFREAVLCPVDMDEAPVHSEAPDA